MAEKTRVLLVEDHKLLRVGLKSIFNNYETIDIIGEAQDGQEAVELTDELKPDIILMDIEMPRMNGIEATKIIKEKHPNIKVIMLTCFSEEKEVQQALAAGANAYIVKDIKTEYMVMVIESVKEGAIWFDPAIAPIIKSKHPNFSQPKPGSRASFKAQHGNLTEREYEVLKLVVDGKSNSEIAQELSISEHTAKAHVCNIIQKLVVDDRTQAAVKAIKEGLV